MTHTYNVTGMTCNGCKASVESALSKIDQVEYVSANVDMAEATITMSSHIELETLQNALADKYKISEQKTGAIFKTDSTDNTSGKSQLEQLFPLFLIFGYISVASVLLNYNSWDNSSFMLDFMGLFFIVFSFFKLLDIKGFSQSFRMYDPLAKALPAYGWIYPFLEVILGLILLMRFKIEIALVVTLVILGITTVGVTRVLLSKKSITCACLGTALKLPMTKATFIENSIMIVMAVTMLVKAIIL